MEDLFYNMAERTGEKSVILCDRGAMDGKAYVDDQSQKLLIIKDLSITPENIVEKNLK